jgi:peptidyl-dipeptidase Dcp
MLSLADMENPLLAYIKNISNDTYVPFDKIRPEHFEPAFEVCFSTAHKNLEKILTNPTEPTFENTVEALEVCSQDLEVVFGIFHNLKEAHTSAEINKIAEWVLPKMAEWENDVSLNEELFEKIKTVHEHSTQSLSKEQRRLLDRKYFSFVRKGALLANEQKIQLREFDQKIILLKQQFGQNLLAATNDYKLVITDPVKLAGLPERVVLAAKEQANHENIKDAWVFTLKPPSYAPFVEFAEDEKLRKQMWIAYSSRALNGVYDNTKIILEIVNLRHKRAVLLGHKNHAEYVLEDRMAKTPDTVYSFFNTLQKVAKPRAEEDIKQLQQYKAKIQGGDEIKPWDIAFFSEKLLKEEYAYDSEEVRAYFSVDRVLGGAFDHAYRLYGITAKLRSDIPVYHPDMTVYEIFDADEKSLGIVYFDLYPRDSKRGGGWIDALRMQCMDNGVDIRPHMLIVCNLTKPVGGTPGLLNEFEARTLFHEFGHALHCLFSRCTYRSLAGFNTLWDFVELPSQLMDTFLTHPISIKLVAQHYETGQEITDEMITKIISAKKFQAGMKILSQLGLAYIDMKWHDGSMSNVVNIESFEEEVKRDYRVVAPYPGTAQSTSFKHIFDGEYDVGYYSYHWSEVLAADAFEYFKEDGLFSKSVGLKFRNEILSKGNTQEPDILYRNFRGKDADPNALLRKAGLIV